MYRIHAMARMPISSRSFSIEDKLRHAHSAFSHLDAPVQHGADSRRLRPSGSSPSTLPASTRRMLSLKDVSSVLRFPITVVPRRERSGSGGSSAHNFRIPKPLCSSLSHESHPSTLRLPEHLRTTCDSLPVSSIAQKSHKAQPTSVQTSRGVS
ncbi:hypothetical protein L226DRAFT_311659 [Lentinus tigrinus ALCF2SS1-7]|uniref:uncharacterized protein n=1 Tax=Lentinus tigrinus ALCF2SS1-7 TaxID=1328758 RepID=UPI0011661369|nr:hypothetical protein L226DRAFT_311659 [Lentinus tigrinus ALCF2SS1-7]